MKKCFKALVALLGGMTFLSVFSVGGYAVDLPKEVEYFPSEPDSGIKVEIPRDIPETELFKKKRQLFPEKFDSSNGNFETVMKDQGELGLCWAYSGTDTIAISAKKEFGEEYYISPNYFNYYFSKNSFSDILNPHHIGRTLDGGGNANSIFTQGALNNLGTTETIFPTPKIREVNQSMVSSDFYNQTKEKLPMSIEKVVKVPGVSYQTESQEKKEKKVEDIKSLIYTYGAATFYYDTKYSHDSKYYSHKTNSTYVPVEDAKANLISTNGDWLTANYGIIIVGWDDNYDKENFVKKPKNNGAFKMKNSWGAQNHDKGYFYMSYEDAYLLVAENIAADTTKETYDHVNSYINGEQYSYINLDSQSKDIYLGNTFTTSKKAESLEAVSILTNQSHINYEIYYLGKAIEKNKTFSGFDGLEKIASGTKDEPGYELLKTKEVMIDPNTEYSIIIKYTYPQDVSTMNIPLQQVKDVTKGQTPHLDAGRSFYSNMNENGKRHWLSVSDGSLWGMDRRYNLWANAYTRDSHEEMTINISPETAELTVGDVKKLDAIVTPENAVNKRISWSSSNKDIATISETGEVTAKAAGKVTITAKTEVGNKIATAEITVIPKSVSVIGVTVEPSNIQLKTKETKQLKATINPENATNKLVAWSSSNPEIATVSKDGEVTGISAGKATIIVKTIDGNKEVKSVVNVIEEEVDDHGDTGETATKIKEGELVKGRINSLSDIDVFEMNIKSEKNQTIVLESPNGYVPEWTVKVGSFWFGPYTGAEAGIAKGMYRTTYFSKNPSDNAVRFYVDKRLVSAGKMYEFIVRVLSEGESLEEVDDHGDTGETATKIKAGELVKGKINSSGDIDVFEMNIKSEKNQTIVLESPNGYVPEWTVKLGYSWYGPYTGVKSGIVKGMYRTTYFSKNPSDNTVRFYVDKRLVSAGKMYEFTVRVLSEGESLEEGDDHGDTGETATKIKEGELVKGKINTDTDIDVFEIALPEGADKTVVLESPNGQSEKFSIQNGAGTWFHQFKGTKEPKKPNQPFRTMYNSDQPKDKLIRFYIDKTFEKVGTTYEFKVTVLQKGQELDINAYK